MKISEQIQSIIEAGLPVYNMEIKNVSDRHIGHAGHDGSGESHFKLMIVSSAFEDKSKIERHRMVNSLLSGLFEQGLHALQLSLLTKDEWISK